ncbi:MAG: lamin tail domain-containing protein, partial [Verrucomicrobiota bacterium]
PDRPEYTKRYRNVVREFRDLIWQPDQINTFLDRLAEQVAAFVPADRDRWRLAPTRNENTGPLETKVADMKAFAFDGGTWPGDVGASGNYPATHRPNGTDDHFDALQLDAAIPATPTITYTGDSNFPVNVLSFLSSAFSDPQGSNTFGGMEWRIGPVWDTNAPNHDPTQLFLFEYEAVWESGVISNFNNAIAIPAGSVEIGLTYRARVRHRDDTDRWSHWSAPVEFTATEASNLAAITNNLRITEVMYHAPMGSDYDFIEFHNTSPFLNLNLDGVKIDDAVTYTFPPGVMLGPGDYLIVAKQPGTTFDTFYDIGVPVYGPYSGNLSNSDEEIDVLPPGGGLPFISLNYDDARGWPLSPDGAGHSLVPLLLTNQLDGRLNHPINWRASCYIHGSPGESDPEPPLGVVINEFAAHTDLNDTNFPAYDSDDWIELYNAGSAARNLDQYYLSDSADDLYKWAIPIQLLGVGDWVSFDETTGFHSPITEGFGLNKAGEQIFFSYLPGTEQDRVVDAIRFKAQENGRSFGRYRDGDIYWYDMPLTRDTTNRLSGPPPVVIREIMFEPAVTNLLEYVELYNPGNSDVNLWNAEGVWRMNGGIEYDFPSNTTIAARDYLILVAFDPATNAALLNLFLTTYGLTNGQVNLVGPFDGRLSNLGERIALEKPQAPDFPDTVIDWVIVDEVFYYRDWPWPANANATGLAFHRVFDDLSGYCAENWLGVLASPGVVFPPVALDGARLGPSLWRLQWPALPGAAYILEATTDLHAGPWVVVGTVTGNGMVNLDDVPASDEERKYYRIRIVE